MTFRKEDPKIIPVTIPIKFFFGLKIMDKTTPVYVKKRIINNPCVWIIKNVVQSTLPSPNSTNPKITVID
ncbi:MAG: hypothetical protein ACJAUD_001938 [Crocinitomicaceae bacterium]|jgi:hypothetical protein